MWRQGNVITAEMKAAYAEGTYQNWKDIQGQLQGPVQSRDNQGNLRYRANSLPEAVNRLFRSLKRDGSPAMPFETFSTGRFQYGQPPEYYPSLEAIHNNMHNFVGGAGFMGDPSVAAFDPIFW